MSGLDISWHCPLLYVKGETVTHLRGTNLAVGSLLGVRLSPEGTHQGEAVIIPRLWNLHCSRRFDLTLFSDQLHVRAAKVVQSLLSSHQRKHSALKAGQWLLNAVSRVFQSENFEAVFVWVWGWETLSRFLKWRLYPWSKSAISGQTRRSPKRNRM